MFKWIKSLLFLTWSSHQFADSDIHRIVFCVPLCTNVPTGQPLQRLHFTCSAHMAAWALPMIWTQMWWLLAYSQGCDAGRWTGMLSIRSLSFLRCRIQVRVFSPCPTVPPHLNICNSWPSLPIIDDFPAVFQRKRSFVSIVTVFSVSGPYTPCLHSCHYYSAPYLFSLL